MSNSKVEVKIGEFQFSGEGDSAWLSKELDKILAKAKEIASLNVAIFANNTTKTQNIKEADFSDASETAKKPLATFLKDKNATVVQTQKFLATAIWLEAKGKSRLITADISKALREASQSKLNNPSESLNQNIKKGFCEKDGKEFYVTQEGKDSVGA